MPLVKEMRHRRSLNFRNERRVIILRGKGLAVCKIAGCVWNRLRECPPVRTVTDAYYNFKRYACPGTYRFSKCGRHAWKLMKDVQDFLVRRLHHLRKKRSCTSTMLQQILARENGVRGHNAIRKCLRKRGYHMHMLAGRL